MSEGDARDATEAPERRPVVYCLIPPDLAPKLHDLLRRHFRDDPHVEIVVDRRRGDRRTGKDRRAKQVGVSAERDRRRIRSRTGRRMGERRAALVPLDEAPPLPRRARRYAKRIAFVERLEPSTQVAEDLDSARLVARIQAGDGEEDFSTLYTRYFDRIYGYLLVTLASQHEAEDAAQEVFLRALENLPDYEHRAQPFRAWLFTIARNHAIDQLRRQQRFEPADPEELQRRREESGAEELDVSILDWISDPDLLIFIERLPVPQRQALILRYTADLTYKQIGAILGRDPADARMLTSRALAYLRQRLTAVGRGSKSRGRARIRARTREATVLRSRRWSLNP